MSSDDPEGDHHGTAVTGRATPIEGWTATASTDGSADVGVATLVATPSSTVRVGGSSPDDPDDVPGGGTAERPGWPRPPTSGRTVRPLTGQWGVALVALLVGGAAWWFSDRHGLALLYADARSHLTISRRLLDGPDGGLVQLGTVWLPLQHLLVAPFSVITGWWSSGFAVVPVNLACLVIESIAVFRVVLLAGRSRIAAWVAVGVLLTNPGWLYLHTTALGEPVLFAAQLTTVAGLAGWVRSKKPYSGGELAVFCGLPAAAGVLTRYDGWAMAVAAAAFVLVVAQMRWGRWRYSLRCLRGFAIAPLIAATWWLWFNFVNWGDPLEFQRGRYSAQAQQDLLADAGLLPDKGDLARSVRTYLHATLEGSGRWVLLAGLLGALAWLVVGRLRLRATAPWLLLAVPAGFFVASLWTGQIALRLGGNADESMFNLRYGLQLLPGLAVMIGLGAALLSRGWNGPSRPARALATGVAGLALIVGSAGSWVGNWASVPVVAEGLQQRTLGGSAWRAARFLHDRAVVDDAGGGLIMIDDSVNPMLPVIGADLDRVSAPFSGGRWDRGLASLTDAEWLFADSSGGGDAVDRAVRDDPGAEADFDTVFTDGAIRVLHRAEPPP